jgi:hypothetical protein
MCIVSVAFAQNQRSINNINNGMPNRISMNVTVPKQTQGATFGEKINTGVGKEGTYIVFPNSQAFFITANSIKEIGSAQSRKVNSGIKATGNAISQGAQLIGGALPGGAIISAAVSKSSDNSVVLEINDAADGFSLPKDLPDGEYTLTLTVKEKATSGLKDTLKTQVRFGIKVESRSYKVYSVAT